MPTDSNGSARWANASDFKTEGLFSFSPQAPPQEFSNSDACRIQYVTKQSSNRAFILGRLQNPEVLLSGIRSGYSSSEKGVFSGLMDLFSSTTQSRGGGENVIGWAGDGHVLTVAPTRSGKGVGLVLPNLLNYPGSVVVIDPKGENYAVSHRYREEVLGQRVVCLDPFHLVEDYTDSINPLDGIVDYRKPVDTYLTQNPELLDEVNLIADGLIMRGPEEKDPHWNDKCRTLLKGMILAVICGMGPNHRRHLSEVRALLTSTRTEFDNLLVEMQFNRIALDGLLSRASLEIQSMGSEELKNVISFALKHTEFLDSHLIQESLGDFSNRSEGSYNLRTLKTEGSVSIYIILPPHYLTQYVRIIRLWVTMAMAAMTRSKQRPADGCPVLFMLDEMAQLGTMEMMRRAVSLLAGYGMSIWMIWQDLSQLKNLYEHDWPSFLANAKIQQFFGINDHETADFVSKMLGMATIEVSSYTEGSSKERGTWLGVSSRNEGMSVSEVGRNLLNPDEIRRLSREAILMFVQGIPPILAERVTYYAEEPFCSRADENPYFNA